MQLHEDVHIALVHLFVTMARQTHTLRLAFFTRNTSCYVLRDSLQQFSTETETNAHIRLHQIKCQNSYWFLECWAIIRLWHWYNCDEMANYHTKHALRIFVTALRMEHGTYLQLSS